MTKVDFYILPTSGQQQRDLFACRLISKAYRLGHAIHIHHSDETQTKLFDERLWSFAAGSFIPHQLLADAHSLSSTVTIGHLAPGNIDCDVLINLSNTVPDFFSRFARVSEIVVQDPDITAATRHSFRFYRDRGYELDSHDLR